MGDMADLKEQGTNACKAMGSSEVVLAMPREHERRWYVLLLTLLTSLQH